MRLRFIVAQTNEDKLRIIRDALQYRRYVSGWMSYPRFKQCLKTNDSGKFELLVGAYTNGKLIAWTAKWSCEIHRFTTKKYRRQGLSSACMQRLVKSTSLQVQNSWRGLGNPLFVVGSSIQ
jgi:hypothetical protein